MSQHLRMIRLSLASCRLMVVSRPVLRSLIVPIRTPAVDTGRIDAIFLFINSNLIAIFIIDKSTAYMIYFIIIVLFQAFCQFNRLSHIFLAAGSRK